MKKSQSSSKHPPPDPHDHLDLAGLQGVLPNPAHLNVPYASVTLSVYVSQQCIGTLIGKGGRTILHIQREACKTSLNPSVWVKICEGKDNHNNNNYNANNHRSDDYESKAAVDNPASSSSSSSIDEWTRVLIRADPLGAFAAARQIFEVLEGVDNNFKKQKQDECMFVDSDIVLDVPLNRYKQHGTVVGKRGATIAALSADHNVRIFVPHKHASYQHNNDKGSNNTSASSAALNDQIGYHRENNNHSSAPNVQLEGTLENVEKCLIQMLAIVSGKIDGNTVPPVFIPQENGIKYNSKSSKSHQQQKSANTNVASQQSQSHINKGNEIAGNVSQQTQNTSKNSQKQNQKNKKKGHNSNLVNSKEEGQLPNSTVTTTPSGKNKYGETLVIVAPSNLSISLAQLRQIGKKTSTIIRRKRLGNEEVGANDQVNGNSSNDTKIDDNINEDAENSSTEFTISGRADGVKTVQTLFDRFLSGESIDSVIESVPKRSGKRRPYSKKGNTKNKDKGKSNGNSTEKPV